MAYRRPKTIDDCVFCPPNLGVKTPPQTVYPTLKTPGGNLIVSFPNMYPAFDEHTVTLFGDHIRTLKDIKYEDVVNYFSSMFQLAWHYKSRNKVGMVNFFNFGQNSGASQEHLHYQSAPIQDEAEFFRHNSRADYMQQLRANEDYFAMLIDTIKKKPELVIHEDDGLFIFAMNAPLHPHHIGVIFKKRSNVLDYWSKAPTEIPEALQNDARGLLGIFHMMADEGMTDANMKIYQSTFDGQPSGFRIHAELYFPTNHRRGAFEGDGKIVLIPTDPLHTAKIGREHYSKLNQ